VTLVGHLRVPGRCAEKRHHDGLVGAQPTDQSLPRQRSTLHAFKYLEDHQGMHWCCTYTMSIAPDTRLVPNPVRVAARGALADAKTDLAETQAVLGATFTDRSLSPRQINAVSGTLHREVHNAAGGVQDAKEALVGVPAKVPANDVNPGATRATPHLAVRSLQMVCRLLAFNAELDLATRLNAYLDDTDEYRAITRNLLHLGGTIEFRQASVTVTLNHPHPPRLDRALGLLLDEFNATPPRLSGDGRPINYRLQGS
ncbi:MAG: hypothetical protein ACRDX8_08205, partial [Acidimicrobiales bacterium]